MNNARLLYKADLANYLEVITAQTARLQAELYLASVQRQELGAMVGCIVRWEEGGNKRSPSYIIYLRVVCNCKNEKCKSYAIKYFHFSSDVNCNFITIE